MNHGRRLRSGLALLAAVMAFVLHACAGGGPDGIGSSGTGIGTVAGFGSVIIDGRRYDEVGVAATQLVDPSAPTALDATGVQLGSRVAFGFEGDSVLRGLQVVPDAIGTVESIGTDAIVVAGQTVRLADGAGLATVFDGLEALDDLAIGDRIEAHGLRQADASLVATRLARRDPDETGTLVTGPLDAVLDAGLRLQIGGLGIDAGGPGTTSPTRFLDADGKAMEPASLRIGDRVAAYSTQPLVASRMAAATIRRLAGPGDEGAPSRLGGLIRGRDDGGNLIVAGVTVDPSAAALEGGTPSDLVAGRAVVVVGTVRQGILVATAIRFVGIDGPTQLTGAVTDHFSAGRFRIRGVSVDASSLPAVFENGTAADLVDGALVAVEGRIVRGRLQASRLRFLTGPDPRTTGLVGAIAGWAAGGTGFTLRGVPVALDARTAIQRVDGSAASTADLADGARVAVTGRFDGERFVAATVVLGGDGAARRIALAGFVYRIDLVERTLRVGQVAVRWTALTRIDGDAGRLRNGRRVAVRGIAVGDQLVATQISVLP